MVCLYCSEKISNDALVCEFCKTKFSIEDQEIMLGTYRKNKQIRFGKFVLLSFLILCLGVMGLMTWLNYLAKKAKINQETERQEFIAWCDEYFASFEDVQVLTVNDTSALLRVEKKDWESLSLNDRNRFLTNLQMRIMKKRQETGLKLFKYYTIQIDDEDGNILSMATDDGQVISEFLDGQVYENRNNPLELTDPLDW